MLFEEFQNGSHLGYQNRKISAILNLNVVPMTPAKFGFNGHIVQEMLFGEFQRPSWMLKWNHFSNSESQGCPDLPPTKFRLNLTYSLGGDTV